MQRNTVQYFTTQHSTINGMKNNATCQFQHYTTLHWSDAVSAETIFRTDRRELIPT